MSVDFGYRPVLLRTPVSSHRLGLRTLVVALVLAVAACLFAGDATAFGEFPLTGPELVAALLGTGDPFHQTVVVQWRLPMALAALVFGALLGTAGAVFQSMTRNPLGSPDVIGFDAGAYTAVVVCVLVVGDASYWATAAAALIGGLSTALVVYLLAQRRGLQGFRLIIVGIAVTAVLGSVNSYLITRADLGDAMVVGFWTAGSLDRVTWGSAAPAFLLAFTVLLAAALLARPLQQLELGDDAAVTQGVRVGVSRLALLVTAVAASALVTASAGPITFVALAAPQLARRLARSPGVTLAASATMGATLLAGSHLISVIFSTSVHPVPVGLVSVCLGGVYLIWLLIREQRRTRRLA